MPAVVGQVRLVQRGEVDAVRDLLALNRVEHCFVTSRIRKYGIDSWQMLGDLLAYTRGGHITALMYVGANLVPIATDEASRAAFADYLRPRPRRCSSFVGPAPEVLDLWRLLEPVWGPARDVRERQPLMAISTPPLIEPDPLVRLATAADLDLLVPASIHMFTEEVGMSPVGSAGVSAYRTRVAEIIEEGRAFVRIDDGQLIFKAEIGAVGDDVCQVQGVWVDPKLRGRGYAAPGMAALVAGAQSTIASTISLYVNDYNTAARKTYERVGFQEVGRFATVLF
jgi:predicted GNAT family acetyltransferase